MRIIDILARLVGVPSSKIEEALRAGAEAAPDAAPFLLELVTKLDDAVSPASLAHLADVLKTEIPNIFAGKIEPRDNPDAAI